MSYKSTAMKSKTKKTGASTATAVKKEKKAEAGTKINTLKKEHVKSRPLCKVTFRLPKEAAQGAKSVTVVGDFNNWNITQTPMKKMKNGDYSLTMELPCNREYNFRYLIDANRWENDWFADKYIPNEFGEDNSVVSL